MAGLKTYAGVIVGCVLMVIGALAGIYQLELHPKTSELMANPLANSNLLLIALPFILVFGLVSGVWLVWKFTENVEIL